MLLVGGNAVLRVAKILKYSSERNKIFKECLACPLRIAQCAILSRKCAQIPISLSYPKGRPCCLESLGYAKGSDAIMPTRLRAIIHYMGCSSERLPRPCSAAIRNGRRLQGENGCSQWRETAGEQSQRELQTNVAKAEGDVVSGGRCCCSCCCCRRLGAYSPMKEPSSPN